MTLTLAYLALTLFTTLFLIFLGFKAINISGKSSVRLKFRLILALFGWQLFIYYLTSTGVFSTYDFPPYFAIVFIFPSFIFTGVFLYANRNNKWIIELPMHWIIYFQSFRILVETLFVLSLYKGLFNYHVTIEGYNFDMIFAFTAPIIGLLVHKRKGFSKTIVLIWNYLGLAVLASVIFLFITSIYQPALYGSEIPLLPLAAMKYPYVLIAGFLMPTAVFLHVLSILQLNKLSQK